MHTLQFIAVKADDIEEASSLVRTTLEGDGGAPYGTWYDWFVVGGGRFSENEGDQYHDNDNNAIAFVENTTKFLEELNKVRAHRAKEMEYLLGQVRDYDFIGAMESYISSQGTPTSETRFDSKNYLARQALGMIMENWNSNAYFYDMETHTASMRYLLEDIQNGGGEDWYLVPVDFHF